MKKNLLSILMLLSLFFVACAPESQEMEEPTLTVSETEIAFPNAAADKTVSITTNQSKWVATSPAEGTWLKLEQQGNNLVVKAMENTRGENRASYILINAGAISEKVMVKQGAADIVLNVSPEEINVPNIGGKYLVDVTSNAGVWNIEKENEADWLIINQLASANLVELTVLKNETGAARSLKLFAKSGAKIKEIIVNQAGTGSSKFLLPLLSKSSSKHALIDYETKQGGYLIKNSSPLPDWDIFTFALSSAVFHTTEYIIDSRNNIAKIVMFSDDAESVLSKEYKEFLEKNNFEISNEQADGFSAKESKKMFMLKVTTSASAKKAFVEFTPYVEQPESYETFASFPYDRSVWLNKAEWTIAKIKETELAEGANLVTDNSADPEKPSLIFEVTESKRPLHNRLFFFDSEKPFILTECMAVWNKTTLGAWSPDGGITYLLTREFKELMAKEGFEFYTKATGVEFYYNKSKKLMIVPRGASFADLLDGQPVFSINYFNYEAQNTGNVSLKESLLDPYTRNATIKSLVKKLNDNDKRLKIRR